MRVGRQLSLFGVEAGPPVAEDLEGLLAGPGQVVRMGGTARVSVVVDELWRPLAEQELARVLRGAPRTHRLTRLPHVSRRSRRLLGPVDSFLVDG